MRTGKSDSNFFEGIFGGFIGSIFIALMIASYFATLGGSQEKSGGRPWFVAILMLFGLGGGYYWYQGGFDEKPVEIAAIQSSAAAPNSLCFATDNGIRGVMVASDGDVVVVKSPDGKLHSREMKLLRTVEC